MRYLAKLWSVIAVMALLGGCGGSTDSNNNEGHRQQTTIRGRAPLNSGGKIRIFDRTGKPFEDDIAADGSFEAKMGLAEGHFVIEASGGRYIEPASGKPADHAGQSLHAVVTHLNAFGEADVAVTPWTEIAYARGGVQGYADSLKALSNMLSCQGIIYGDVLAVPPALPVHGIHSLSNSAALGYIYLGAFSQLAHDLSQEIHLEQGRLGSMRLAKILAEDFSDGRVDGHKDGVVIYLVSGHALPADVLRQRLAQAARHFLQLSASEAKDWGNLSSIGEDAMLDLLSCISENTDVQLGPPGERVDREGPVLAITTPAPGSYLASAQDVVCEAHDPSGVASLDAVFLRADGTIHAEARGTSATVAGEGADQRFVAPLRIEKFATGDMKVRCNAADRWGNTSSLTETFHVNRGGIAPTITVPADNQNQLAGLVEITCDCQRDEYSERCDLQAPDVDAGLVVAEPGDRIITYAWDTTKVLDGGPHTLTCFNVTRGLPRPLVQATTVRVKNHIDGIAEGAVYLDTPVKGMQVTAFAFKDGEQGRRLGGAEVEDDGKFSFPVSTEYRGPLLLRADYSRRPGKLAEFHNVPLDKPMSCTNAALTLLIEHYEPGEALPGLSINVATTMHEAFAGALWQLGKEVTFYQAARTAQALVANYLSGSSKPFDPRRTWVANLNEPNRVAAHDQMILGLFHVGLSRLGVDRSLKYCRGSDECITISEIIEAMRRDLSDGKLDGKVDGVPVYMPFHAPLTEDFFRIDLARAIRRWLDKTPYLGGKSEPANKSGLTVEAMTARSPVLQNFAKHHSALFDNRPGEDYDGDGPHIEWRAYGADQNQLDLTRAPLGDTSFRLVVKATDESGIARMEVTLNGEPQRNHSINGEMGNGEYLIRTSNLDGPQKIAIVAQDAQGNPETVELIHFTVDRVRPDVALERDELWTNDGGAYQLVGTVVKPHVTARVFVDDAAVGDPWNMDTKAFAVPLPLFCGASHRIRIEVRDAAGNTDSKQQVVHCDNRAPTLGHLSSPYTQEQSGAVIELEHRLQADPKAIQLMDQGEAMVLEKQWNHLDDGEENKPPTLRFSVGDVDGYAIGTPPDALRVSYKYIFRGAGVTRERDWTPITCTREGACKVVMSYQTMLPEDVLRQPVNVARRQNFIAYSSVNDLHSVLVKVEDLAGNVTMGEWSVRLRLFSPPVNVECRLDDSLLSTSLMGGATASLPNAAGANFPVFNVDISSSFGGNERSLTPLDGAHVFTFKDSALEWRIDRVMQQVASLGKSMVEGNWMSCKHNRDFPIALLFADGECQLLRGPSHYPRQWGWSRQPHMGDLIGSQAIRPQHFTAEIRAEASSMRNTFLTLGQPQKYDGVVYPISAARPIQGHSETQYSYRVGWEYGGNVSLKMDERRFIKDLRIIRPGAYRPEYAGSKSGTPAPIKTNFAAGCDNAITASWRENHGPTLHIGAPPDINDLVTHYGPLP